MPHDSTFTRTCPAPGSGISRSTISKGPFGRVTCATRIFDIAPPIYVSCSLTRLSDQATQTPYAARKFCLSEHSTSEILICFLKNTRRTPGFKRKPAWRNRQQASRVGFFNIVFVAYLLSKSTVQLSASQNDLL